MKESLMRSEYRKTFSYGVKGIKCACCRPCGCNHKDARRIINRRFRRLYARIIRTELVSVEI